MLAFSAEPGSRRARRRRWPNSPYAAAVMRHFGATNGEEFGTVMRMVAEEVYLKTFGPAEAVDQRKSASAVLFRRAAARSGRGGRRDPPERRQLLLTIAALPDLERPDRDRRLRGGVPMDALYGMLRALGQDAPDGPAELDRLLRAQTEKLKELIAERDTLKSTDAEIVRLSGLADKAVDEGALDTALRLLVAPRRASASSRKRSTRRRRISPRAASICRGLPGAPKPIRSTSII